MPAPIHPGGEAFDDTWLGAQEQPGAFWPDLGEQLPCLTPAPGSLISVCPRLCSGQLPQVADAGQLRAPHLSPSSMGSFPCSLACSTQQTLCLSPGSLGSGSAPGARADGSHPRFPWALTARAHRTAPGVHVSPRPPVPLPPPYLTQPLPPGRRDPAIRPSLWHRDGGTRPSQPGLFLPRLGGRGEGWERI